MATDITDIIDWEILILRDVSLAETSAEGGTSLVFDSDVEDETGAQVTKATMIAAFVRGQGIMRWYIAAGGFTSKTAATVTTRQPFGGGLDITTADTANDFTVPAGTPVFYDVDTIHAQQMVSEQGGDLGRGMKLNERPTFKTTGLLANRVFADATARDAAITSPTNGDMCYLTDTGVMNQFIGGGWTTFATGTTANGSATVAGKYEEATVAEQGTQAATGSTGARLVMANANIVKTSSGAGDENKLIILDSSGQAAAGFIGATADATATEIGQLSGTTNIAESDTFFGATNISGAEAETLTDGSNASALHNHPISFKIGIISRSLSGASGTVQETGIGFEPDFIEFTALFASGSGASLVSSHSTGAFDGTTSSCIVKKIAGNTSSSTETIAADCILLSGELSTTNTQKADVSATTSDSFTLNWTKTGSPTGTGRIYYKAYKFN